MLGSIFIGFGGMTAYSKGLSVIGNNVANLNTAGFKGGEPLFSNLVYRNANGAVSGASGTSQHGAGVAVDTNRVSFRQGDLTESGNPLDAAIDGSGFFVLDQGGRLVYTRAGQFEIDEDGYLIHRGTRDKVRVTGDAAVNGAFNVEEHRVFLPAATTEVALRGNLTRTGAATYSLGDINVRDSSGTERKLSADFTRDSANALVWTVEIRDEDGNVLGSTVIEFGENGTPSADYAVTATVEPEGLPAFDVVFKLGAAGTFAGVTSTAGNAQSVAQVGDVDGVALGYLSQIDFTDQGQIELSYSNGEKKTPATLLLARFLSPAELRDVGGGIFMAEGMRSPVLAQPLQSGIGRIVGGQIELSNVDLTDQFADLIIVQRGYQASSQLTSVANELIQQLLALGDRP
jgi:flagellar hook protein FlgE